MRSTTSARPQLPILTALAALALVLAACGAPNPPVGTNPPGATNAPGATQPAAGTNPPGGTVDACSLVTDAELEQVTGLEIANKGPSGLATVLPSVCDYEFTTDSVFNHASLTMGVMTSDGRSYYETYFEPFIGDESGYLDEAVSGIGDKAARGGTDTIMAVRGDALVDVQYVGLGDNRDEEMPVRIMQLVLSKLP